MMVNHQGKFAVRLSVDSSTLAGGFGCSKKALQRLVLILSSFAPTNLVQSVVTQWSHQIYIHLDQSSNKADRLPQAERGGGPRRGGGIAP